ncbi:hypothetical protein N566_10865 [Streptomycetaceae bacterium MP113-05]|nr:hypothetical protein N566_10865 [Streptomycetaceae bacterium MP113-05]
MSGDDHLTMPPVRLPSEAELARHALAAPLLARAVSLARWAEEKPVPVGAGGELLADGLREATERLGTQSDPEAVAAASEAWNLAVDIGLLDVDEDEDAEPTLESDEPVGTASGGAELERLAGAAAPSDVLDIWQGGLETVLADAATPSLEGLLGDLDDVLGEDGGIDPEAVDLDVMDWDPEEEADFLDSALVNLYLFTLQDPAVATGSMVPLPVLAASMIVPDDMDEPTDDVLEEVSAAMMRLDEQFRIIEPTGLLTYLPVDEALTREADDAAPHEEVPSGGDDEEDVSRYGMVRLTTLGLHGLRQRLLDAGIEAPLVGDLADADAAALLGALVTYPETGAREEVELWFAQRPSAEQAARELLTAARGLDDEAPGRRLVCQQALSLAGEVAEPALRDVLDDAELGGLARVWLVEHGARDVPPPDERLVFWLAVDTLAAQLATSGEPDELRELIRGLVDQHAGFFDKAWQVDHPAAAEVLEAMGRLHPDKKTAKEARKAAFKARSAHPG